ncbi:acyl-CoA desaturase [Micromonospora sp. NPDC048898]|uniref:acyl-CoA desaturase n=1 Tax=Micromonospora sp. NPDC048898 TaxID=3364260 RepID=UPI0037173F00
MNGREHRWFILAASVIPLFGIAAAMALLWNRMFGWSDVAALVTMYVLCGLGISMGYHRLFAHRAFETTKVIRYSLATVGSMAGQGPPLIWVSHHRHHHRVADRPGDPHSPHLDFEPGFRGMMAGLWHAHLGWLFNENLESSPMRYCPDLVREKPMRWISEHFVGIVLAGIVLPGIIGAAIGQSVTAFLTGMLWGGLVRIFLVNHITYAVNSVGHYFGKRAYPTEDESRNVAWLALPSFGEAWHNNHHAFPRSARHGLLWWQIDVTATVVWALERVHLVTKVIRIDPERMAIKAAGGSLVAAAADRGVSFPVAPDIPLANRDRTHVMTVTDVE